MSPFGIIVIGLFVLLVVYFVYMKMAGFSELNPGEFIASNDNPDSKGKQLTNGDFALRVNSDNTITVVNTATGAVLWSINATSPGVGPFTLTMQSDKNLVLYDVNGKPTWATDTWRPVSEGPVKLQLGPTGVWSVVDATGKVLRQMGDGYQYH